MIVVRAPLRVSFVGGGTDIPDAYSVYPGKVISATIDKFVYLVIKPTPLVNKFIVKYQKTESVDHPSMLEHDRVRETLLFLKEITNGLEIGSFADLPAKTGLGSSSSFSVALMKGLHSFLGKTLSKGEVAEMASHLEITLLKEPIGKQDQYAAAFGGCNVFTFNSNHTVSVAPVPITQKGFQQFEKHLMLFFTGITRTASSVLSEQRAEIPNLRKTYKDMADSVSSFERLLLEQDFKGMGQMLTEGWMRKKSLARTVSSPTIDALFDAGICAGSWGGKMLGAGGGGCFLFVVPPKQQIAVREALVYSAKKHQLLGFQEIPFSFTTSGTEIIFSEHPNKRI